MSDSPAISDRKPLLTQARWRLLGAFTLGGSLLMAVYSASTDILRESALYLASIAYEEARESAKAEAASGHFVFWGIFVLLIGASLYLAILDMRYIRLQYLSQKREIFGQTLGDSGFRESLLDADRRK
jgi:hypothetical protein